MGRIEVFHENKWGTVCDSGFDLKSGSVLCRSLGYGSAESLEVRSNFGRGIGEVWLQVKCAGNEQWLHECNHLGWGETRYCDRHEGDVGVRCRVPSNCTCNDDQEEELVSEFNYLLSSQLSNVPLIAILIFSL